MLVWVDKKKFAFVQKKLYLCAKLKGIDFVKTGCINGIYQ